MHWQEDAPNKFELISRGQTPCTTNNSTPYSTACVANHNKNIKYENDNENIKYENCIVMWYGPPNFPRGVSGHRAERSPAGHLRDVNNNQSAISCTCVLDIA